MLDNLFRKQMERFLSSADIIVGGTRPWDIQVHDPATYRRTITEGNLGLGEAYMDGYWDSEDIEGFFFRLLCKEIDKKLVTPTDRFGKWIGSVLNLQCPSRAFTVGKTHYDIGNDLYEAMLDRRMIYSCAYWKRAASLDEAQEHKLRLVFDKMMLKPGMTLLDIGCGWGGAARYAAEQYGVSVLGITVSEEQARFARDYCAGLAVRIELADYRELKESFDRIYSIGMFEHVGYKNYRSYFEIINRYLKPDGISLLHTIGCKEPCTNGDQWTCKYIFPNSMLPSASQITSSYEGLLTLEDWHVFTYDYYLTLMAWYDNFEKHWNTLQFRYNERFHRMWRYYLLSFAGAFHARSIELWQVLFSKNGILDKTDIPR